MTVADATASGLPYPVTTVNGESPRALEQFVGDGQFEVSKSGHQSVVRGVGSIVGPAVRFHEKSDESGKDVRVWLVAEGPDGTFVAATA